MPDAPNLNTRSAPPEPDAKAWTLPSPLVIPELTSERLVVREFCLDDVPAVYDAIVSSREANRPWMWWSDLHQDRVDTTKFVADQIVAARSKKDLTGVGLGVFERSTGSFVGGSGFHNLDRDTACAETGYWIRHDLQGRGYAGEACARTISWMLAPQATGGLGLRRVVVYVHGGNDRSLRVLAKLGLRKELHQRAHAYREGLGIRDWHGWGVLADEWDCEKHAMMID